MHLLILYNDNTITLNCFENDMLIPLSKPINDLYNIKLKKKTPDFQLGRPSQQLRGSNFSV
mgnify:CR=1 FL=1